MSDRPEAGLHAGRPGWPGAAWLPWASYLIFTLILFVEVWVGSARLIARDLLNYFMPIGETLARAWHGSGSFLWDSGINTGMPFAARWGAAVFYPAHALFALLPVDGALTLAILMHCPLAAGATMRLALRYTDSRAAAWLAGLGYGFGGYCLSMSGGGIYLYGAALLPLDLLALHRLLERWSPARVVQLALVVALQVFCADPQTLYYCMLVIWPCLLLLRARAGERRRAWLGAAAAGLLGAGIAFCQIWPTMELARLSVRAHGFSYQEASTWAFHPLRLLEIVVPSVFGGITPELTYWPKLSHWPHWHFTGTSAPLPWALAVHVGLLPLLGLLWLQVRERRRDLLLWGGLTLFFLLCALGPHVPVLRIVLAALPGANRFRYAEKFIVFVSLGLVLLGAMGLGRLLTARSPAPRRRAWVSLAALGGVLVALRLCCVPGGWLLRLIERQGTSVNARTAMQATAEALLRGAAVALLLMALVLLWPRLRPRLRVGLLLVVAGVDLLLAALPLRQLGGQEWLRGAPAACRYLPPPERGLAPLVWRHYLGAGPNLDDPATRAMSRNEKFNRWEWNALLPNVGTPTCVRHLSGYEAATLDTYRSLMERLRRERPRAIPWIFGVRLSLAPPGKLDAGRYPVRVVVPQLRMLVQEMPRLPFAYAVPFAESVASAAQAAQRVSSRDFDFRERVTLEGPGPLQAWARGAERRVELVTHRPGHVRLLAELAAPGYLVVLETMYPGWRVTVDGRPGELRRANGHFMGLAMPAGRHEVTLAFEPRRQRDANGVTLASLAVALAWVGAASLRRWRRSRGGR